MSDTSAAPITRSRPNTNREGAGLLMTLLQRYADQGPERTRRELSLAKEIDAYEGGRAAVEEAVRRWRALPLETQVDTVGRAAATIDARVRLDDDTLMRQAQAAFRPVLVRRPEGIALRPSTLSQTPLDAPPFTLTEGSRPPGKLVTVKQQEEPGEDTGVPDTDRDPGKVIGNPPSVVAARGSLYQIEFAGIWCRDETSWDQGSNSDEIYCSFNMFDDSNHSWARRSAVYGDVDSGNSFQENPRPCVLWGPAPQPTERVFISTLMMEHDFGNPNDITKLWHDAATIGACVAKYYGVEVDAAVVDSAANLLDKIFNFGDDVMGWDTAVLWPEWIVQDANAPLIHWKGLSYHFFLFHTNNDAEFFSFYRTSRF